MTDLSPAAQAVLDATDYPEDWATRIRVAAALRAAVEQVLPEMQPWHRRSDAMAALHQARREFLAIAAELEGRGDG